jgi:mercuric ion binding protein
MMNKLMKFSFALLAVVFSVASCSESTAQSKTETQVVLENAKMTMNIEGMTCAMGCARAIEVELNNIEGVEGAKVDFESENATLSYNGSLTSESSIVDFVNNYRSGTYKASAVAAKKCSANCTKPCCDKAKKACCASKKKSCSKEEKAKCEASSDKSKKACSAEEKAGKACCAEKVEKSCGADCTKPCCA